MFSPTDGYMTKEQMFDRIVDIVNNNIYNDDISIVVGTDSQKHHDGMRFVTVVLVRFHGHGGRFFYATRTIKNIHTLRDKIYTETQLSLELAEEISQSVLSRLDKPNSLMIHSDIGRNGDTKVLIAEIVGWVRASGYECSIKPYSFVASGVANMISK